ncbi:MAG: vitamin K epoxide reductase family protein [Patescibacteria group bacterium]
MDLKRLFPFLILALAILGFLDAVYLTAQHYLGFTLTCPITGCSAVLKSSYAAFLGFPISLYGAFYYLAILVSAVAYLDTRKEVFLLGAALITIPGFLITLYLIYLQLFVINSICLYCLISATTTTALFGLFLPLLLRRIR